MHSRDITRFCVLGISGLGSVVINTGAENLQVNLCEFLLNSPVRGCPEWLASGSTVTVMFWILVGLFVLALASWPIEWAYLKIFQKDATNRPANNIVRLPLIDFLNNARKAGWDIDGQTSLHLLDLAKALRQSALDGDLKFWGKLDGGWSDSTIRHQPLEQVPADHWREYEIEALGWREATDNFYARTYAPKHQDWGKRQSYVDLHIDKLAGGTWLKIHPAPPPTPSRDISLSEAARIAYEETRQTAVIATMEHVVKDPAKMIGFMASQLLNDGAMSVFGAFPPSTASERIPADVVQSFHVTDDATEMFDDFNEKRRYTNLTVRRDDFRRHLDHLKSTKWTR